MRRGKFRAAQFISTFALCVPYSGFAQAQAQEQGQGGPAPEARDTLARRNSASFSVPLVSDQRTFGDVQVEVNADGSFRADAQNIRSQLEELLNERGQAALDMATSRGELVSREELRAEGFELEFDTSQLVLRIGRINPKFLRPLPLKGPRRVSQAIEFDVLEPARFSSYLNLTGNYNYDTRGGAASSSPDVFFDGATRVGDFVLEYDGALTDQFSDSFSFFRRSTRLVYDDRDRSRRYTAGDITLNTLSVLRNAQIGGIGVEKSRRIFNPARSINRLGGRQIFLDNRSTVDVIIDGQQFDSIQLDAGTYDLSSLPVQQGSNDIQLRVRDSFGRIETYSYDFFFEPLDLVPGEEEYSFALGLLSQTLSFQPDYSDTITASGFYRKALSSDLILGGAIQASEDVQVGAATITVVPQFIPGVFDVEAAYSNSTAGSGGAVRAAYRFSSGNSFENISQLSLILDYESAGYRTVDNLLPINFDLLSVGATYSRSFSQRMSAVVGGNYVSSTSQDQTSYNVFLDVNFRLSDRLQMTVGGEFGEVRNRDNSFGLRAVVSYAFGGRTRGTIDYRSLVDSFRANISRGSDQQIGSFGYDVSVARFDGEAQSDVQLQYVSNRFTARADVSSAGDSFGGLLDEQRARIQIGTSLAVADGTFGIGRPVSNSFIVARPHEALRDKGIVTARTLNGGNYYARSGALGAALQGDISPFSEQSIQYDAADPEDGFDVGDGTVRLNPPYRSGYKLVIGNEYFVSVIGILADANGPVSLASGRVVSADGDEDFEDVAFFTNAAGRFGLFGLAPGKRYRVDFADSDRSFVLEVPEDDGALVRLGTIEIPVYEEE